MKKSRVLLATLAAGIAAAGCKSNFLSNMFSSQEMGVPLTEFSAKDGDYFPPFVKSFFKGSRLFSKEHRTVAEARSEVKMIEVRQLNDKSTRNNEANLSWSADGAYLGFEVIESGFRKIMLKDLVGDFAKELRMIPKGRNDFLDGMVAKSTHSYNAGLRWSQDSTRFAFMSNGGVGEYNIYVGAVGVQEEPVARSPTKDGYASWSPSTNEIAFVSGRSGNGDIYLVNLETKKVDRLSAGNEVDIFPEWFPSAGAIVYSSGDALNHNLVFVERKGKKWTKPRKLTSWSHDDLRPTVSPDGKYIAFYSSDSVSSKGYGAVNKWNIHVVPFNKRHTWRTSELKKMLVAHDVVVDLNTGPAWSPDSRKIFYVKRDPKEFNPIHAYDMYSGRRYKFDTNTKMNRDILMSRLGVLSFRAQVGVWDKVFVALTNQGLQLQGGKSIDAKIHYLSMNQVKPGSGNQ